MLKLNPKIFLFTKKWNFNKVMWDDQTQRGHLKIWVMKIPSCLCRLQG